MLFRSYNLTVSHSHRFVWYRVAKVATRTIRHHCETHGVSLDVDHAMRVRYPLASFADYFTFAFVRYPLVVVRYAYAGEGTRRTGETYHVVVSGRTGKVVGAYHPSAARAVAAKVRRLLSF